MWKQRLKKIYCYELALSSEPQIWKFHGVVWQTTSKNCTKKKRAGRLFFLIQPIKSWICGLVVTVTGSPSSQNDVIALRPWQTRTHCCRHIVAHDVSWARKRAGHKMNVVFPACANWETVVADTKCFWTKWETFFVSVTNAAHAGKRGNICVSNNVSATMCPCLPGPFISILLFISMVTLILDSTVNLL